MATFQELRTIVGQALADHWTYTPIQVPNETFDLPAPSDDKENDPAAFLQFEIRYTGSDLITMGGMTEDRGYIDLYIFLETGAGDKAINAYMEALRTIFKTADTEDTFFLGADPGAAEFVLDKDPSWIGRIISIPFLSFHD